MGLKHEVWPIFSLCVCVCVIMAVTVGTNQPQNLFCSSVCGCDDTRTVTGDRCVWAMITQHARPSRGLHTHHLDDSVRVVYIRGGGETCRRRRDVSVRTVSVSVMTQRRSWAERSSNMAADYWEPERPETLSHWTEPKITRDRPGLILRVSNTHCRA